MDDGGLHLIGDQFEKLCDNVCIIKGQHVTGVTRCTMGNDQWIQQCTVSWEISGPHLLKALTVVLYVFAAACVWSLVVRFYHRKNVMRFLNYNRYTRNTRLMMWAKNSRIAAIFNMPIQFLASLGIYGLFMARMGSYRVVAPPFYTASGLYGLCMIDYIIRFLAARHKWEFVLNPIQILDVMSFVMHFEVGFGKPLILNGIIIRTWMDFDWIRTIIIWKVVAQVDAKFPRSSKGVQIFRLWFRVIWIILFAAGLIFMLESLGEIPHMSTFLTHSWQCRKGVGPPFASDKNLALEDPGNFACIEKSSISSALYFTFVTLATVGYGEFSPSTLLSRLLVILMIVFGIIMFSVNIDKALEIINLSRIGNRPYRIKPNSNHVVVMGNPSPEQVQALLRELFHLDHDLNTDLRVVLLGDDGCAYANDIVSKIDSNPLMAKRVYYIRGNPMNPDDLRKAKIMEADAAFFIPYLHTCNPQEEDTINLMNLLSVRRMAGKQLRCIVTLLQADNLPHILAAGVQRNDIICVDETKLGLLAQTCRCPGFATLVYNVVTSYTSQEGPAVKKFSSKAKGKSKKSRLSSKSGGVSSSPSLARNVPHSSNYGKDDAASPTPLLSSSEQSAATDSRKEKDNSETENEGLSSDSCGQSETAGPLLERKNKRCSAPFSAVVETAVLSSGAPRLFSQPSSSSINSTTSTASNKASNASQFIRGAAMEIYLVYLSEKYSDMTFLEAAVQMHRDTGGRIVAVGAEVAPEMLATESDLQGYTDITYANATNSDYILVLNPAHEVYMTPGMPVYVLAESPDVPFKLGVAMSYDAAREILLRQRNIQLQPTYYSTGSSRKMLPMDRDPRVTMVGVVGGRPVNSVARGVRADSEIGAGPAGGFGAGMRWPHRGAGGGVHGAGALSEIASPRTTYHALQSPTDISERGTSMVILPRALYHAAPVERTARNTAPVPVSEISASMHGRAETSMALISPATNDNRTPNSASIISAQGRPSHFSSFTPLLPDVQGAFPSRLSTATASNCHPERPSEMSVTTNGMSLARTRGLSALSMRPSYNDYYASNRRRTSMSLANVFSAIPMATATSTSSRGSGNSSLRHPIAPVLTASRIFLADSTSPLSSARSSVDVAHDQANELYTVPFVRPPPLSIMMNPRHIVVCSNAGEEGIVSIKYFLLRLRDLYSTEAPPVTLLCNVRPTSRAMIELAAFGNVYHVWGSPLSYRELQRAGAMTAATVVVLADGLSNTEEGGEPIVSEMLADSHAIFITKLVESGAAACKKRNGKRPQSIIYRSGRVVTELSNDRNHVFLPRVPHEMQMHGRGQMEEFVSNHPATIAEGLSEQRSARRGMFFGLLNTLQGVGKDSLAISSTPGGSTVVASASAAPRSRQSGTANICPSDEVGAMTRSDDGGVTPTVNSRSRIVSTQPKKMGWASKTVKGFLEIMDVVLTPHESEIDSAEREAFYYQPRFLAGQLYPSQITDTLMAQTYFNPNINGIVRQLIGGSGSTSLVYNYALPLHMRQAIEEGHSVTYGNVWDYFADGVRQGIATGIYRAVSSSSAPSSFTQVWTGPSRNLQLQAEDRVFVIVSWHVVDHAAKAIARLVRSYLRLRRASLVASGKQRRSRGINPPSIPEEKDVSGGVKKDFLIL